MGSLGGLGGGFGLFGGDGLDSLTGGSKAAKKANKKNLSKIKDLFEGLNVYGDEKYGEALKSIEGIGAASKSDAQSLGRQQLASSAQHLQSMGLSGTTAVNAAQRGINSDTMRTLGRINEDIARMRAGLFTGQAGFRQQNVGNLASILGGVQYQPGTNYVAEAMKILPFAFCDRRIKRILGRVDIRAGADGIPFGVYRFTYKSHPEAGVFEGVIAQEVAHLPGVVLERLDGLLLVDSNELRQQTGVVIRSIGAGVAS